MVPYSAFVQRLLVGSVEASSALLAAYQAAADCFAVFATCFDSEVLAAREACLHFQGASSQHFL